MYVSHPLSLPLFTLAPQVRSSDWSRRFVRRWWAGSGQPRELPALAKAAGMPSLPVITDGMALDAMWSANALGIQGQGALYPAEDLSPPPPIWKGGRAALGLSLAGAGRGCVPARLCACVFGCHGFALHSAVLWRTLLSLLCPALLCPARVLLTLRSAPLWRRGGAAAPQGVRPGRPRGPLQRDAAAPQRRLEASGTRLGGGGSLPPRRAFWRFD